MISSSKVPYKTGTSVSIRIKNKHEEDEDKHIEIILENIKTHYDGRCLYHLINNKNINDVRDMFSPPIDVPILNRIKHRLLNHSNNIIAQYHLSPVQRNIFFNSIFRENTLNKLKMDTTILEKKF